MCTYYNRYSRRTIINLANQAWPYFFNGFLFSNLLTTVLNRLGFIHKYPSVAYVFTKVPSLVLTFLWMSIGWVEKEKEREKEKADLATF